MRPSSRFLPPKIRRWSLGGMPSLPVLDLGLGGLDGVGALDADGDGFDRERPA